jgi:hypothetical protein
MDLTAYANEFGTDKGTIARAAHSYTTFYDLLFAGRRHESIRVLEIGLATGGPELGKPADRVVRDAPSIRMWHEFFPKANIYGLDISDFSWLQADWLSFIRADCGNEAQLRRVAEFGTDFDIIVDDGSHASFHQQLTLVTLFEFLRSGGLYIIEDLDWQPRHLEEQLPSVPTTVKQLRHFISQLEFIATESISSSKWAGVAAHIRNVHLVDDDELYGMRRMYNRRGALSPESPHYFDTPRRKRLGSRGHVRRIAETSAQLFRAVNGRFGALQRSRVKLAVIQKF